MTTNEASIAPNTSSRSPRRRSHQLVYSCRSESESVHGEFDLNLWNRRMIAYGVERQRIFVLGFALSRNATRGCPVGRVS
ncbi:hypothetical protein [Streptomyces sp. NPDC055749]